MTNIKSMSPHIISSPLDLSNGNIFFDLTGFLEGSCLYLKLEWLNQAGSIKLKPALEMIESLELEGRITPGKSHLIESSSGNMGVALSIVCKAKGYKFTCVTDVNINSCNRRHIEALGGIVRVVKDRDHNGGYVQTRIELIQQMLKSDPDAVWLNQYANYANSRAHFKYTASEIFGSFSNVDFLFVGVGTSGTLMGCIEYAKQYSPKTRVIAVDVKGSVIFGYPPGRRYLPGLGCSRRPELVQPERVDDIVMVDERDAIKMCYKVLDRYQILLGPAAGSVLVGVASWSERIGSNKCVVTLCPDFGERYLDTLYNQAWREERFPSLSL
jgi:N-(2-amino-2-carboxyethyl)-L-glutamate synthase